MKKTFLSLSATTLKRSLCLAIVWVGLYAGAAYATDYSFGLTSLSLSSTSGCGLSTYTFSQKNPNPGPADINGGATFTITFPATTDATTATVAGSSIDGNAIAAFTTQTATTLAFALPATINNGTVFNIVIANVTNGDNLSSATCTISADNATGGTTSSSSYTFSTTACPVLPPATCSDAIQNQGETGVDCGGPCDPCPTCDDGIQNQGETNVDCGGPCGACSCANGIQDQGETGIDCGGPCGACGTYNTVFLADNIDVNGNFTILDGALDVTASNRDISLAGNWINTGSTPADGFIEQGGEVSFDGSAAQSMTATNDETFYDLQISNTSATGVTLNDNATVTNGLFLVDGIVYTASTDLLIINNGATSTTGSSASFVDGPMRKIGNSVFTFPLGDGSVFARIGISAPTNPSDAYDAEYFDGPYTNTTSMEATLNNVSTVEYWNLDRTAGASDVSVTLYWEDGTRSGIDLLGDLVVARFDAVTDIEWKDKGQSSNSGTAASGSVTSNGAVSQFGPFTFGSLSSGNNPLGGSLLPIEIIALSAKKEGADIVVNWVTASEVNNDYYTLERSADGEKFESIAVVDGAGTTSELTNYTYTDKDPLFGLSYYRVKQTDLDGTFTYTEIVSVRNELLMAAGGVKIYPNPVRQGDIFNISLPDGSSFEGEEVLIMLTDVMGREVFSKVVLYEQNGSKIALDVNNQLEPGVYMVLASNDTEVVFKERILILGQ